MNDYGRGICPVCVREYRLMQDGRIYRHSNGRKNVWPPQWCKGTGELPADAA